jgi:RNA polymerase sigma-70 factor (ECF subfamily)
MYAYQPRGDMPESSPEDIRAERDQMWFNAMRGGDATAFESLFQAYAAPLAGFVYRYLRSREAAEDVVQDLFIHLWERRETLTVWTSVRTYLFTIARNNALNVLRRRRLELRWQERVATTRDDVSEHKSDTEDQIVAQELESHIAQTIAGMSERSQQVFLMNRQDGLTYQEIADILGIAVKTVEMHMSRALTVLRSACERWR